MGNCKSKNRPLSERGGRGLFLLGLSRVKRGELSPEIERSQVSFKTVFTVGTGVLFLAGLVYAIANAILAVALTGAALLIAVSLDHVVRLLERRGVQRPYAIAIAVVVALAVLVGFGFTLIPPALE